MSLAMQPADRSAFLAEPRLGVLTTDAAHPPLASPIWYDLDADGRLWVITGASSQKAAAIDASGRFGLVVHEEARPYRYVSVEGPVAARRACELERDLLPMAVRYLGEAAGQAYADQWASGEPDDVVFVMEPQRWGSADHTPMYEHLPG